MKGFGKRGFWVLGLVVLAVLGLGFYQYQQKNRRPEVKFETATADRGRITSRVTATGTISALVTVQVGSQVSGRISELHADFNSQVRKGQVLAKLDPQLFEATVEQARANYLAAQSNLTKAKAQAADAERQFTRSKSLAERKLIAQADLDTAQANFEVAQAQVGASQAAVEQTRASLHQAEVNLTYTTISSPIDGVVISRSVDVGQTVAASLQAPTLFIIAEDMRKMQVDTSVAEADVGKLQPDMPASFRVDAYPNEVFKGKVRQIRSSPQTVQNVVTYDAVIDVENPELKLRPGMTANVTFVSAQKDDVVRIPNAALRFRPDPTILAQFRGGASGTPGAGAGAGGGRGNWQGRQRGSGAPGAPGGQANGAGGHEGSLSASPDAATPDRRTIWVLGDNQTPRPVSIRTGISDGTLTEVAEGELHEGDTVVTDMTGGTGSASGAGRLPGMGGPGGPGGGGMRRMF